MADTNNNRIRIISLATGTIETFAGDGKPGYSGDGGPARRARLNHPTDVAVGPEHDVYIADTGNHVVRRIDALGTIETVAGNGAPGFSGDRGAAARAQLDRPCGVFVDAHQVLYIADTGNHVIRRVQLHEDGHEH